MGASFEAFIAGQSPKVSPTLVQKTTPITAQLRGTTAAEVPAGGR